MLNHVKAVVENGVKVEAKEKNQYGQYPVIVQDVTEGSVTKDWSLTYYARLITNGNVRLYDGKEAFSALTISRFSNLYNTLMAVDQRFATGDQVEVVGGRRRAIYEIGNKARFSVVQFENSTSITLTITDPASPFHMLSVNFRVIDSKKEDGKRHLIGSENQWDLNSDTFVEHNASLSPKKKRYLQVYQEDQNTVPYIKALARPGMNNTTQVDPNNSDFLYIQDVTSKYKALAYIYEQTILEVAMEKALPLVQAMQSASQPAANGFELGFGTGAFAGGFGMPAQPQTPANNHMPFGAPAQAQGAFGAPQLAGFGAEAPAQPQSDGQRINWGAVGGQPW
jgi:hypothetical protein